MILVKEAQLAYAKTVPGLMDSINQAMASIKPYLICSLLGIKFDEDARQAWIAEGDRLLAQYIRIIGHLTGPKVEPLISNKKCVQYFHNLLRYPIVGRSAKTNNPSLDEKNLYKLKLKHENPVIDFLIAYRKKQKEIGTLGFNPWKPLPSQGLSQSNLL